MISKYPDKHSLKQAFDSEMPIGVLKDYCRQNGIFLLSSESNNITTMAHLFYWGYYDINSFSSQMEDTKNYKKSVQITLNVENDMNTHETPFDCIYQSFLAYRGALSADASIRFDSLTLSGEGTERILQGNVVAMKKRPGRVQLLDEVPQRFSFELRSSITNSIVVDIIYEDRGSVQAAKKMLNAVVASSEMFRLPQQISLNSLTTQEKVELFDRFFMFPFDSWRVEAVRNIKLEIEDVDADEDEEVDGIEQNVLSGIKTAIFTGTSLRQNPIIVDAVMKGYYFPKATVMLEHRRDAIKLLLEIAFTGDEMLLELSVVSTFEIEENRDYKRPLMEDEQKLALKYFHEVIAKIHENVISERVEKSRIFAAEISS